jgi:hypothetical protein
MLLNNIYEVFVSEMIIHWQRSSKRKQQRINITRRNFLLQSSVPTNLELLSSYLRKAHLQSNNKIWFISWSGVRRWPQAQTLVEQNFSSPRLQIQYMFVRTDYTQTNTVLLYLQCSLSFLIGIDLHSGLFLYFNFPTMIHQHTLCYFARLSHFPRLSNNLHTIVSS